ncbi:putative sulfate exporter family transporter, partial [bacterium]
HALGLTQQEFGLWSAIAIHDTSSVVGAAARYGDEALALATTVNLSRALWIVPLAMGLAIRRGGGLGRVRIPWFILFFLVAAAMRTLWPAGGSAFDMTRDVAVRGLTLTLFLIGTGMSRDALRETGLRPLVQGVLLWLVISIAGLVTVQAVVG